MKISILCNDKSRPGYANIHGFSVHIETPEANLIYDTGNGSVAVENALKAGIDLNRLDGIVISHGHYDHTGGLTSFLKETGPIDVYTGRGAFEGKFKGNREIGFPLSMKDYEELGARIKIVGADREIFPGVKIFTGADLSTGEQPDPVFLTGTSDEKRRDLFEEELTLAITDLEETFVITGCSHRGIGNILLMVSKSNLSVKGVLGGFHLDSKNVVGIEKACQVFEETEIDLIAPCHCTQDSVISRLKETFSNRILEILAGDVITPFSR